MEQTKANWSDLHSTVIIVNNNREYDVKMHGFIRSKSIFQTRSNTYNCQEVLLSVYNKM